MSKKKSHRKKTKTKTLKLKLSICGLPHPSGKMSERRGKQVEGKQNAPTEVQVLTVTITFKAFCLGQGDMDSKDLKVSTAYSLAFRRTEPQKGELSSPEGKEHCVLTHPPGCVREGTKDVKEND